MALRAWVGAGLACMVGLSAHGVEPDPVRVQPLTVAALRRFATQHEEIYKRCLREGFGTEAVRLIVALHVDGRPSPDPPLRGDLTPDPWTRRIEFQTSRPASAETLACMRKPTESFFRNASFAYRAPSSPMTARLRYKALNARSADQQERLDRARETVAARIAERQNRLNACVHAEDADRAELVVHYTSLGDGSINLDHYEGEDPPWQVGPCIARALGIQAARVGDAESEFFSMSLVLVKPDGAPPRPPPDIPDTPTAM